MILGYMAAKRYPGIKTSFLAYTLFAAAAFSFFISMKFVYIGWSNPPNIYAMFYSVSFFVLVLAANRLIPRFSSFFKSLMGEKSKKIHFLGKITFILTLPVYGIAFIGRHSLHVFLWQTLTIPALFNHSKTAGFSSVTFFILVTGAALLIGMFCEYAVYGFKKYLL